MNELAEYITQFGSLDKGQMELLTAKAKVLELRREEHFSVAGNVPRQVGFIIGGVVRGYYYSPEGDEITRCFIPENNMVVDYPNFEANTVSAEYLQACTDSRLIVFSGRHWEELSTLIPGWDVIKGRMVQSCMYRKSRKHPVISQDATTRYLEFLENYPGLVNRVTLSHIASYLGVTQQSLSRIRKNIR